MIGKELENYRAYEEITDDMSLRDKLVVDRTVLAKERTDLAYFRTAISFVVAAITLYKLFEGNSWGVTIGGILLISAAYVAFRGVRVSLIMKKRLKIK